MYAGGITNSLGDFILTLSCQMTTPGICRYGVTLISSLIYMDKSRDIFRNGLGVFSSILTLSELMKAGI